MSFKGADFLAVAHLLSQRSPDEGCVRTSISRAYYASFHSAQEYCATKGVVVPTSNAHTEVRRCLESLNQHVVAEDLRILHDWRKNADYDVPFPLSDLSQTAVGALTMAESILSRLSMLDP